MAAAAGLLAVGGVFLAAALAGAVADRVGLSVIPVYVVAGVVVGPNGLGRFDLPHVPNGELVATLAELGIVLLLFFLGLEFSIERLLSARRKLTAAGVVDLVVNFPAGVLLGLLFGWSLVEALLLGGIVYISSSAIITKSLIDLGWIADSEAEPILGVLVFEDLAIAIYLAVVVSLVTGGDGLGATVRGLAVSVAFLALLVAAVVAGTALFQRVLDVSSPEQFVLRTLAVVVPVAGAALTVGASEAVAAFFVGMGFASTDHAGRIERRITPIRDTVAAVFFLWIGLGTDPFLVGAVALPLAAVVLLTVPTKVLSGFYAGRVYDLPDRRSVRAGAALVARGEFSLVIAATAALGSTTVMTRTIPALAVGYVLVMSTLGTWLMGRVDLLERLLLRGSAEGATTEA